MRILLGSSYYEDWADDGIQFVEKDPLGNPVDKRHPWNQTTIPKPQKRNFNDNYSWVMAPRWLDKRTDDHLALDTGGGPIARLWSTALSGLVDVGYVQGARDRGVEINLPKSATLPAKTFTWKIPQWSNAIERDRARTYFQAYAAAMALHFVDKALEELQAGRTRTWADFEVPNEAIGCGFHEAVRGVLSHHVVIRDGKIANYHPYPPTPWNASPRDIYGTPGPYEDAVQNTPIFEENGPDNFKGIDIMRAVRSFDPCLPCGVHMYHGGGKLAMFDTCRCSALSTENSMTQMRDNGFLQRMQRIETLVHQIEQLPDPAARAASQEVVQALLELHGAALEKMVRRLEQPGNHNAPDNAAEGLLDELASDELVGSVLLLHDLHPWPLERRVAQALSLLQPALQHHGGDITLREASPQRIHVEVVRGQGGGGCGSSADGLRQMIQDVLGDKAPEVPFIEIDGLDEAAAHEPGLVQITVEQASADQ